MTEWSVVFAHMALGTRLPGRGPKLRDPGVSLEREAAVCRKSPR